LVFTGSSLLEILNARADLSRRAVIYLMQGLSFREYVSLEYGHSLPTVSLSDLLAQPNDLTADILTKFKPLQYFSDYLKHGYYPYYREEADLYAQRVEETINMILEIELPMLRAVDIAYV